MLKQKQQQYPEDGQPLSASTGVQFAEFTKGKKRKRKGAELETVTLEKDNGRAGKGSQRKGAGKLMRFNEEGKAEGYPIKDQEKAPVQPIAHRKPESRPKGHTIESQPRRQQPGNPKPSQGNPPTHLLKRRDALLPTRKSLPIWPHAEPIRAALRKNNVLVLTGETGSGKSTQVPQFLLSEPWCTKTIAITQPRRVAAISLARRVAEEMGSLMGNQSPAAKVGYSVRFDNATGPGTRVKFLTEGMLLQEMLRDPEMSQYSAVVVDEVHERSVNVDLILGFLKNLVAGIEKVKKRKTPLKVVVMSATADVEALVQFFGDGVKTSIENGKIEAGDSESKISNSHVSIGDKPEKRDTAKMIENFDQKPTEDSHDQISTCFVEGRQYPVKTIYLPQPTQDWVESALKIIFQIHYKEPLPGDILVFLTGQDTIEGLEKLINEYAQGMDSDVPKLLALPLFAALPQHAQQRIFTPTPHRTRKVILATNIAETSVTVPGVRFVIDCGKSKIKQFRNRLGLESLLVKPISKSAAIQRKGRAGREAAGQCYRLYTEKGYEIMEERTTPEILRCDLSHAILTMKARGADDVLNFPFLDRPPREALEKALLQLLHLSALEETGAISEMGLKMAKLPLTPTLGRVLVEAARPERDCLLDVVDIISALSVENIFLNLVTEERKEEAEAARRELYRREGDHMTLLVTVQRYSEERSDRKVWCEKHFVSHRAMQNVMNIKKQLLQQCSQLKLLTSTELPASSSSEAKTQAGLACILRGFISNTARLMPDGSYRTLMGNQTVSIHPSSVLFGRKTEAIVFSEFVFTGKAWARGVSAVQLDWVSEVIEAIM
ncbi:P-loop containing nucleoside triphosphate hydrolase protein [Melanomma pulvis-pyrius CBS 109.77]|uniref:RNA helicase n=1 Tax=Melanomma pulvis-pyrius CBS 109.77 TaxID=1314802 RepID=A0A6A6XSF2_9PLEO|nr:P-loop containing nucleoside triphosphate hydrolase protein [Melanomma pulvis-pyrius CBS 109.77]